MNESLDEMYRDIILDHYRSPRGKKPLEKTDIASEGHNPSCGDEIDVELQVDDDTVKDVHVNCHGCAISVASGSMLAEIVKGRTLADAFRIAELVKKILKGEEMEIPEDLGDLDALKGVRQFPVRIKCALLSWVTLMEGLKDYKSGQRGGKSSISTEDDKD